ncbi:MAG: nuclear transport factor 2 family protein [Sphingobium phenoxybenzoativorans]|uniref:nuclear transport factor 2 family protein n=1 Tax=Sphingobium phenoxybenzoativorans TaxID=1592790 RepID=UPI000872469E|nr:nuclear transport factor 2 family protein [Sphingobium phenoxybenzoativorans]
MSHPSPRDVATGFFEDVSAGRVAEAWDRLAPDVIYDVIAPAPVGRRVDRDGLGAMYADGVMAALAEPLRLEIKGVTAEGERVAVEVESHSVNKRGMIYNNRYHFLFVIREGKIVEGREYLDSAHLIDILDV